jgi:hypothetical protein
MEQVIYVVKCLSEGQDKAQIIGAFEDDEQLVSIWIQLAKELAWLESQNQPYGYVADSNKWVVSDKGMSWLKTTNYLAS